MYCPIPIGWFGKPSQKCEGFCFWDSLPRRKNPWAQRLAGGGFYFEKIYVKSN